MASWTAPSASQEELRVAYLTHLDTHEQGWARGCAGAHLTASSLIWAAGSVLLTLHAKLGKWLQTGGHLEPADASLEDAALREATEESGMTGLRLDPVPLLLSRHEVPVCGFHLDVQFLVRAPSGAVPVVSAESRDVAWFPVDALPEVDDSVRDLVDAAWARVTSTP